MEAIKESVSQLNKVFHQKLADFEERQQKLAAPSSPNEGNLAAEFAIFKAFTLHALRMLQSQVELLAQQSDNLEMHSRRKILLLHGVAEDKKEDTTAEIVKLVSGTLEVDFAAKDVSRCHRIGNLSSDRSRPILFKVRDVSVRAAIWAAKAKLKGSGVTLSEFLTKSRHDTFMAARERFGVAKCWTRDGSVFVLDADGTKHRISRIAELDKIPGLPETMEASAPLVGIVPSKEFPTSARPKRVFKSKVNK